ncbi:MAG: phosphotransferase [Candidatus Paracaedibacter sp.]
MPLSKHLKEEVDIDLLVRALATCASSQRKAIDHVDALIAIGVPDWRLTKLPELYLQLIKQEDLLKADGLTSAGIKALHSLHPKFLFLCDSLSKYNIPETLEHADFHGNNILLNNNHLTIGDWGDAVISHPFYSLVSYLNSATRHHGLGEGDEDYVNLQNIYLNKWVEFEDKDRLLEAFRLAKRLRPLQISLSFIRVKLCPNFESSFVFTGYIAEALRDFIKAET